jgi:hypothetical protein
MKESGDSSDLYKVSVALGRWQALQKASNARSDTTKLGEESSERHAHWLQPPAQQTNYRQSPAKTKPATKERAKLIPRHGENVLTWNYL